VNLPLAYKLSTGTLRARPTLTVLAIFLLALGTSVLGGLLGTAYLLHSMQTKLLAALTVELELAGDADSTRANVMARIEQWPGTDYVQYITADVTLYEIERETGENLRDLFGTNPFPSLVRVRFRPTTLRMMDSLASIARGWPEVTAVSYPRRLWNELRTLADQLQSGLGIFALAFVIVVLIAVGFCLRAQVRNRSATWDFLLLIGMPQQIIRHSILVQEILIGIISGLLACGILALLSIGVQWLLMADLQLPLWFYPFTALLAIVLAYAAGVLSPHRFAPR
jgi:cell division protein FtsX